MSRRKICYFVVLAASYDLLLGYTGIVSFAHTMFFGIGGYGAGLALSKSRAVWTAILLGTAAALVLAVALAWSSACSRCGCGRSSSP